MRRHFLSTTRRTVAALLCVSIVAVAATVGGAAENSDLFLPAENERGFRYDIEYPAIGYSTNRPEERIAALQRKIDAAEISLTFDALDDGRGYLDALLHALDINPDSQLLVFSKTSVNSAHIHPRQPRSIFFNDDTYVAWVPGAGMIEIASMDPELGPVFFVLEQSKSATPKFDRQTVQCLRCHDSLTLTGGGVPRFILGSGYINTRGDLVSHEGWILTDQETPLKFRWGGWYVTGSHGSQKHLGNIVVRDAASLQDLDSLRIGNLKTLDGLVETTNYPSDHSDIAAHLVIEHQVHVQNLIARVNYDVRTVLAKHNSSDASDKQRSSITNETKTFIEETAETLVKAMLFADEAILSDAIVGSSDFAAQFENQGPSDQSGRSLRELDLRSRLFRYPLSYLVYSEAFDALPDIARNYVYKRFAEILLGGTEDELVAKLTSDERATIFNILSTTKPEFAATVEDLGLSQ